MRYVLLVLLAITCAGCVTVIPPEQEYHDSRNSRNHENLEPDYGFTKLIIWEW